MMGIARRNFHEVMGRRLNTYVAVPLLLYLDEQVVDARAPISLRPRVC